jgi:hypothetical protein
VHAVKSGPENTHSDEQLITTTFKNYEINALSIHTTFVKYVDEILI